MRYIAVILTMLLVWSALPARMVTNDLKIMKIEGPVKQIIIAVKISVPTYQPDGTNFKFKAEDVIYTNINRFNKSGFMTEKIEYFYNGKVSYRYTWEYTNERYISRYSTYRNGNPLGTTVYGYSNDFKTLFDYTLAQGDTLLDAILNYDDDGTLLTKTVFNRRYNFTFTISNVFNDRRQLVRSYRIEDDRTMVLNDYIYSNGLLTAVSNFNRLKRYFLTEQYEYDPQGREVSDEEFNYMYSPYSTPLIYRSSVTITSYDPSGKIGSLEYRSQNGKNVRKVFEYDRKKNVRTVKFYDLERPGQDQSYRVEKYNYLNY